VTVFVPAEELNVALCVQSGQTFRWRTTDDGWSGVDGTHVINARRCDGGWELDGDTAATYFRLDLSLAKTLGKLRRLAPEFANCFPSSKGLRVLAQSDAIEVIFAFLCSQNNHMARIQSMVAHLGDLGNPIGRDHFEFPRLEKLATLTEPDLRRAGFGYRAATIGSVARQLIARGEGYVEDLRRCGYESAHEALCTLRGIGPKLADCICLFSLGYDCAVPVDTHVWARACDAWFPKWRGASMTALRYRAVGDRFRDRFGDLAGWAQQYVFLDAATSFRKGIAPVYSERC
jgi:N-glycosylase/DNA lyase